MIGSRQSVVTRRSCLELIALGHLVDRRRCVHRAIRLLTKAPPRSSDQTKIRSDQSQSGSLQRCKMQDERGAKCRMDNRQMGLERGKLGPSLKTMFGAKFLLLSRGRRQGAYGWPLNGGKLAVGNGKAALADEVGRHVGLVARFAAQKWNPGVTLSEWDGETLDLANRIQ